MALKFVVLVALIAVALAGNHHGGGKQRSGGETEGGHGAGHRSGEVGHHQKSRHGRHYGGSPTYAGNEDCEEYYGETEEVADYHNRDYKEHHGRDTEIRIDNSGRNVVNSRSYESQEKREGRDSRRYRSIEGVRHRGSRSNERDNYENRRSDRISRRSEESRYDHYSGSDSRSNSHSYRSGHSLQAYKARHHLYWFSIFAEVVREEQSYAIFKKIGLLRAPTKLGDVVNVLVGINAGCKHILNRWAPGIGDIYIRASYILSKVIACGQGFGALSGNRGSICDDSYGREWGLHPKSGNCETLQDYLQVHNMKNCRTDIEVIIRTYLHVEISELTGSERIVVDSLIELVNLLFRKSDSFSKKDLSTYFDKCSVIVGAIGNSYHEKLGNHLVEQLINYTGLITRKIYNGGDVNSHLQPILEEISYSTRYDWNGAIETCTDQEDIRIILNNIEYVTDDEEYDQTEIIKIIETENESNTEVYENNEDSYLTYDEDVDGDIDTRTYRENNRRNTQIREERNRRRQSRRGYNRDNISRKTNRATAGSKTTTRNSYGQTVTKVDDDNDRYYDNTDDYDYDYDNYEYEEDDSDYNRRSKTYYDDYENDNDGDVYEDTEYYDDEEENNAERSRTSRTTHIRNRNAGDDRRRRNYDDINNGRGRGGRGGRHTGRPSTTKDSDQDTTKVSSRESIRDSRRDTTSDSTRDITKHSERGTTTDSTKIHTGSKETETKDITAGSNVDSKHEKGFHTSSHQQASKASGSQEKAAQRTKNADGSYTDSQIEKQSSDQRKASVDNQKTVIVNDDGSYYASKSSSFNAEQSSQDSESESYST